MALFCSSFSFLFAVPLQGTITTQWPLIAIYLTFQTVSSKHKATVHGQYISIALVGTTAHFSENKITV